MKYFKEIKLFNDSIYELSHMNMYMESGCPEQLLRRFVPKFIMENSHLHVTELQNFISQGLTPEQAR